MVTLEPKKPHDRSKPKVDYEVAKAMKAQGLTFNQIGEALGCKPNTLKVYFSRNGFTGQIATAKAKVVTQVKSSEQNASEVTRNKLAAILEAQASVLAESKPSASTLGNSMLGQGDITKLKGLAEVGKIVHGWGNDSVTIRFGVSMLSDRPEPTPVDVTATVTQAETPVQDDTPKS